MKKVCFPFVCCLVGVYLASCSKSEPEEPEDSCLGDLSVRHPVTVSLDVDNDLDFYKEVSYDPAENGDDDARSRSRGNSYSMRYVVKVFKADTRQLVATMYSPTPDFTMDLPVGKMEFIAWADYSLSGSLQDELFLTDDFHELIVASKFPYEANNHHKRASWGLEEKTVAYNTSHVGIRLVPVMAQIQLIATDERKEDVARIRVSYPGRVPCAINGFSGDVCYSWAGVWFDSYPVGINNCETLLAYDNILCNPEETVVPVRIDMTSTSGTVVARSLKVDVPIRRGGITEVRGPFYSIVQGEDDPGSGGTTGGGISIDPGFDDEFEIIIK